MFLLLEGTPRKFNSSPPKNRLAPKKDISSSNHPFFRGELLNFGGVRPCCFVFAWRLRCVLDDLNNAPGEALSSLLGALTRQERIFVEKR